MHYAWIFWFNVALQMASSHTVCLSDTVLWNYPQAPTLAWSPGSSALADLAVIGVRQAEGDNLLGSKRGSTLKKIISQTD